MESCFAEKGFEVDYGPLPDNLGAFVDAIEGRDLPTIDHINKYGYAEAPMRGGRTSSDDLDGRASRDPAFGLAADECASRYLQLIGSDVDGVTAAALNQGEMQIASDVQAFAAAHQSGWAKCMGNELKDQETPLDLRDRMLRESNLEDQIKVALRDRSCQLSTKYRADVDRYHVQQVQNWLTSHADIVDSIRALVAERRAAALKVIQSAGQ